MPACGFECQGLLIISALCVWLVFAMLYIAGFFD
jgi:hypothetical protein